MKATLIGRVNPEANGFQQLWVLDPPLTDGEKRIKHVVTSEIDSPFWGCECLVFEAMITGKIVNWSSIGGGPYLTPDAALETIGCTAERYSMNTQRNRFIRWQMKRWKRQGQQRTYLGAKDIWITYQWLGRNQ